MFTFNSNTDAGIIHGVTPEKKPRAPDVLNEESKRISEQIASVRV